MPTATYFTMAPHEPVVYRSLRSLDAVDPNLDADLTSTARIGAIRLTCPEKGPQEIRKAGAARRKEAVNDNQTNRSPI